MSFDPQPAMSAEEFGEPLGRYLNIDTAQFEMTLLVYPDGRIALESQLPDYEIRALLREIADTMPEDE